MNEPPWILTEQLKENYSVNIFIKFQTIKLILNTMNRENLDNRYLGNGEWDNANAGNQSLAVSDKSML